MAATNQKPTKAKALQHYIERKKPTNLDTPLRSSWEDITSEKAVEYLELRGPNRTISQSTIDRYARDMVNGKWRLTHQGIAFDKSGHLYDGEHRLWAIVQSGVKVRMMVTRGLDPDTRDGVDAGKLRSAGNILEMMLGTKMHRSASGIAKRLMPSLNRGGSTRSEQVETYLKHREAIDFACELAGRINQRFLHVAFLAPIARAWYSQDREKLAHFAEVMATGISRSEDDDIVIHFRNWMLSTRSLQGVKLSQELYEKTERVLFAFLNGERLQKIYPAKEELFLIPGEE